MLFFFHKIFQTIWNNPPLVAGRFQRKRSIIPWNFQHHRNFSGYGKKPLCGYLTWTLASAVRRAFHLYTQNTKCGYHFYVFEMSCVNVPFPCSKLCLDKTSVAESKSPKEHEFYYFEIEPSYYFTSTVIMLISMMVTTLIIIYFFVFVRLGLPLSLSY